MPITNGPIASIIIPTRDRAEALLKAIQSVLTQSFGSCEIVIVDDGSEDDTASLVRSIGDPRVRYVFQDNRGAAAARNRGVELATGQIVVFLDSDDRVLPGWLGAMMEPFAVRNADLVFCGAQVIWESAAKRGSSVRLPRPLGPAFNDIHGLFLAGVYALRKGVFELVGGFDPSCSTGQHTDLALRLAELHEQRPLTVHTIMAPYVQLIQHADGRLSQNPQKRLDGARYLIAKHATRLTKDRHGLANYWSIAGVCAYKLGRRELAASCFLESASLEPLRAKSWLRYLMSISGLVPPTIWKGY
jgi:glycosyltransferase involved in cell wall biosynthesis